MEAIKPLVVLVLFGTILYGAYSVVQKGPTVPVEEAARGDAPPFVAPTPVAPQVELTPPTSPVAVAQPVAAPVEPVLPVAPPAAPLPPPVAAAAPPVPPPAAVAAPVAPPAPAAGVPAAPAAAVAAATAAVAATAVAPGIDQPPTYLNPQAAAPPAAADSSARPERYATLTPGGLPPTLPAAVPPPAPRSGSPSSAAFASAWTDAHDKLTAGRYAEALAGLTVWYDDPSLGLEESQRLEDLLGQLAGTVIYSQQDLLQPPYVVTVGETLEQIAAPLGVSPRLLAKINGIDDPARLVPGEHIKVLRGPFDAVVSISRRRLSLQLGGSYAGSFPVLVGRQFLGRVGSSLAVAEAGADGPAALPGHRRSVRLSDGLVIEAVDDPTAVSDNVPPASLVVSVRDLDDIVDILGPGSRVLVRQ